MEYNADPSITLPEPTINNISIVWEVNSTDINGEVSVLYRKVGDNEWKEGMSLRAVPSDSTSGRSWGNRHCGSLFDLDAGAEYEARLTLRRNDGTEVERLVKAKTRTVPTAGTGPVTSVSSDGELLTATYRAEPGEIIQLEPGTYKTLSINQPGQPDGVEGAPITIRGGAGIQLNGTLGIFGRNHWRIENLTVNGWIRLNGSKDCSIVGCTVNASQAVGAGEGIACWSRGERLYIANNTITGVIPWEERKFAYGSGDGITVTGPGHVIQNNFITNCRDGISLMEDGQAVDQYSIDILDNEIQYCSDDGIEADFGEHNIRVMRNKITNSFIALSSQPALGGPVYFIRNQAYSIAHLGFKLYRTSIGNVILHNTIVKHGDPLFSNTPTAIKQTLYANNIFMGGERGNFNGYVSGYGNVTFVESIQLDNCELSNNAYSTVPAGFKGQLGPTRWTGISQLRSVSGDPAALEVDYDIFANNVSFPSNLLEGYDPVSLELSEASSVRNAGLVIPNINDDFTGTAPDLGAVEYGGPVTTIVPTPTVSDTGTPTPTPSTTESAEPAPTNTAEPTPSSTVEPTPTPSNSDSDLVATFVDAETNQDVQIISDGDVIETGFLWSINTTGYPSGTRSVRYRLTGEATHTQIENIVPYTLFGDSRGNYSSRVVPLGDYTVKIQCYSSSGGNGTLLAERTVSFTTVDGSPLPSASPTAEPTPTPSTTVSAEPTPTPSSNNNVNLELTPEEAQTLLLLLDFISENETTLKSIQDKLK